MRAFAAVAVAPGRVEYRQVDVPEPGAEDVVIQVAYSWISNGTEGSFVRGERIAGDTPWSNTDPLPFPHVPGYQKVGVVESVGAAVTRCKPGDRVFGTVSRISGMFYDHGGHVSPAVTHQSQVWVLPDNVSAESVSGLVLTQVGYNVGTCAPVSSGDSVVVIGDGMVGHWSAQTYQQSGARVLMLGRHGYRLKLFETGPDDMVVDVSVQEPLDIIRQWAPAGINLIADTVGSLATVESLYPLVRRFACIVSAGFYGHNGKIDIQKMRNYEMSLRAPSGWTSDRMDETLDIVARGTLKTSHLITHRYHAGRAGQAFELILSKQQPVLGVVLCWQDGDGI